MLTASNITQTQNMAFNNTQSRFEVLQASKTNEQKALATKFAINFLKVNRWDKSDPDYVSIYQTVWVEKMMLVQTAYGVNEVLQLSKQILEGQKQLLVDVGIIVSNTGQILKNQEVIIQQNGEILLVVKENLEVSYEILGNVKDIKASVEDMQKNGVNIKVNNYKGGGASYIKYLVIAGIILIAIVYIKKKGKKKGGK